MRAFANPSLRSFEYKTELDSLLLGPIPIGASKFTFHCDPPDVKRIPDKALLGIVGLRLSCDYLEQEFVSVGYYVENDYDDPLMKEIPPSKPDYGQIMRTILAEKPIVTVFSIQWDTDRTPLWGHPPPQPDADAEKNDEASYGTEEGEDQAATTHGTEDDKAAIAGGEDLATQDTSFSSGEDDGNTSDACDMDSDSAQGEEE